jgi:hypothetical protein
MGQTINRWEDGVTPRYGWQYRGSSLPPLVPVCQMCCKARPKYFHAVSHSERIELLVGACCAAQMCVESPDEDYRASLRYLQGVERRRERWLVRKWRLSQKQNYWIRANHWRVTVYRSGARWGVFIATPDKQDFKSLKLFDTLDAAKLSAFDAIEELRRDGV